MTFRESSQLMKILKVLWKVLKEFIRNHYLLLLILIAFNLLFYMLMPIEFLSFMFSEIALLLILGVYKGIEEVKNRVEVERLLSLDELLKHYHKCAKDSAFKDSYRVLLEVVNPNNSSIWVPGIVEEIVTESVKLKPVNSNGIWVNLLEILIEPYEHRYRNMFQALGWNEFKVRPREVVKNGEDLIIYVEPTTYYYSFITNFSCDLLFSKTKSLRTILEPYIISSSRSKPLKSINECKDLPISNHLGINILIITSDGNLLLSERSSTVAVEQKRIGLSLIHI